MIPAVKQALPTMSDDVIAQVKAFEVRVLAAPQTEVLTKHVLHAGMYVRTIMLPAGDVMTGACIKIPTVVTVCGDADVYTGEGVLNLQGYNVLPAQRGRKQAFYAHTDTHISMAFPTHARTVEAAEAEFTDDYEMLMSRLGENEIVIGDLI